MENQEDSQSQQSTPSGHHYRTYSSLYYNADNHDQGPVSPIITTHHDQFPESGLFAVHDSSLVSPINTDNPRDEQFEGVDGRDTFPSQSQISPVMSRPGSSESDRNSNGSGMTAATATIPVTPQTIRPAPAFIAHFGAVQVVREHQLTLKQSSDDDELVSKDDIQFSEAALSLVNSFLDHLLYSILSQARSTNLSLLKPAMTEVLRRRLAREAIANADEELRELLAENDEEEELNTLHNSGDRNAQWDLELIWRRTRLRVMVYMRLGELEDEDEERYIKEEELLHGSERRFSQSTGLVSWAAAIFLTSILEYIAEQTLRVAGRAAYARVRRSSRVQRAAGLLTSAIMVHDPITVEEHDVEKVALDTVLGRSWRAWRKSTRSSGSVLGHRSSASRDSTDVVSRHSSFKSASSYAYPRRNTLSSDSPRSAEFGTGLPHQESVLASSIPLPLGRRDVDEIEVPGLARDLDARGMPPPIPLKSSLRRRKTLTDMPPVELMGDLPLPLTENNFEAIDDSPDRRPSLDRRRSASAPPPAIRSPMPTVGMPGAFPFEEQGEDEDSDDIQQRANSAVFDSKRNGEDKPEPKANAAEMAPYKRVSQIPLEFRSAGVEEKVSSATTEAESAEPVSDEPTQQHSIVGTAIAGASAAVVATAASVAKAFGATETSRQDEGHEVHDGEDTDHDALIDRRKSLVDIKAAAATPARSIEQSSDEGMPSNMASRKASPTPAETTVSTSDVRRASTDSFTLEEHEPAVTPAARNEPKKRLSMSGSMLTGSARVRDSFGAGRVSTDRSQNSTPATSDAEQQARGTSRRSSRLYLGSMLEDSPRRDHQQQLDKSIMRSDSPYDMKYDSAEQQLASTGYYKSGDQTDAAHPLQSVEEARSSLTRPPGRRTSVPGLALTGQLMVPDKSARRQSRNATLDKLEGRISNEEEAPPDVSEPLTVDGYMYDAPRSRLSMREAMDSHYVASPRYHETSTSTGQKGISGLTSASIRGPEDFDLFAPNDDSQAYESALDLEDGSHYPVLNTYQSHGRSSDAPTDARPPHTGPSSSDTRSGRSQTTKRVTAADTTLNQTSLKDKRRSVSRPPQRNTSVHKSGLMAREPRVMTESTRDFADFIRSTGPNKEPEVLPLLSLANRSTTSLHSLRSAHINGSRASLVGRTKSLTRSVAEAQNIPPVPTMPPTTGSSFKPLMQPRGASGKQDGNSELIDFIRSGPNDLSTHRISRTVAPFRSTMDSDQLNDMGNSINGSGNKNLTLNTNVDATLGPMSGNGTNGHNRYVSPISSGGSSHVVHPAHAGGPAVLSGVLPDPISPADGDIFKKRYRVKDPYAVYDADLMDNDENILTALPNGGSSARKEESLAEFLNSSNVAASTKDFVSNPTPAQPAHTPVRSPPGTRDGAYSTQPKDLTSFLRQSSPREDNHGAPAPVVSNQRRPSAKDVDSGHRKSGFFGVLARARSKRSAAAKNTYLDLR